MSNSVAACLKHCFHAVEPEEVEQAEAKEDKGQGEKQTVDQQESMQIEEVSQQEDSSAEQNTGSSSQQGDSVGVMGAVMGAAKSLFGGGGMHDEKVCLLRLATCSPFRLHPGSAIWSCKCSMSVKPVSCKSRYLV